MSIFRRFIILAIFPPQREDWDYYAQRVGLPTDVEHDPWEMMIAYKGRCVEDKFIVDGCDVDYSMYGINRY